MPSSQRWEEQQEQGGGGCWEARPADARGARPGACEGRCTRPGPAGCSEQGAGCWPRATPACQLRVCHLAAQTAMTHMPSPAWPPLLPPGAQAATRCSVWPKGSGSVGAGREPQQWWGHGPPSPSAMDAGRAQPLSPGVPQCHPAPALLGSSPRLSFPFTLSVGISWHTPATAQSAGVFLVRAAPGP